MSLYRKSIIQEKIIDGNTSPVNKECVRYPCVLDRCASPPTEEVLVGVGAR